MDLLVQSRRDCQMKISNLVKLEYDYVRKYRTERMWKEMGVKFHPPAIGVPEQFPQASKLVSVTAGSPEVEFLFIFTCDEVAPTFFNWLWIIQQLSFFIG